MSVFVGHTSAYEFWRTNDLPQAPLSSRACPRPGSPPCGVDRALEVLSRHGVAGPVHVVVADANDRRRSEDAVVHVWAGAVPAGTFLKLDEGLYIKSPAASFVDAASELSLVELIRYGYVLCSSYAYDEEAERGFRERVPLTTVRALTRAAERERARRGSKKAFRALRYIADASASPMETIIAMALCLPRMLGGYGLDLPELNHRVEAREGGLVKRSYFKCDLYWPNHRVAVEYDSDECHTGRAAETRDSARRSALMAQGVTVVTITTDQFFDARKFDEAARAVAKLTGKRLRGNDASWMMKRYRLRTELLQDLKRG